MSTANTTTDAQTPPKYMRIDFDRMPPELKSRKNWLIWAAVWNGSKWTKRPIQISGHGASTTNSKHWSTFDEVKQAYEHAVQRGHMELRERGKPVQQVPIGGVGFVFDGQSDADGLVFAGVDFDKVITGREIASLAEERIKRLGSYTERSVSGGGLHVILKARPLASGIAHGGVEMYTSGRYFTMTGRAPDNARLVAAPEPFAALADELQSLAGNSTQGTGTASANGQQQGKFTAADRERLRKQFGDPDPPDGTAVNTEEIRSAVSAIPPSVITTEAGWMKCARALAHSAAVYKERSEELWDILDSASRVAPGYNEPENRKRWLRYIAEAFHREKPITIATVFDLARKHGWRGWSPSGTTENTSDASEAKTGSTASPPPELKFSLSDVPPHRQWLYGVHLLRGDLTLLVSPGGAGKTSLALGMAVCTAIGKPLLGEKIYGGDPLKSLYINAEDSGIEMRRRALAFCQQHNITEQELDRLYIAGTDDPRVRGLSLLRPAGQNSSALDQAGLAHLENLLVSMGPDLVVIDPLIALCGGGNVNDNAAMASVMREIKRLAIKFSCSILIVAHTKKGGDPGSAEAVLGASAIKDLARCARMPVTMTVAEMTKFGVLPSERPQYFKLVDAKSNLALHSDETWYKLESQELPNAEPPTYPHGDHVQAVVRVQLSVQSGGSGSADDMKVEGAIFDLVDLGKEIDGQAYPYSPSLAGKSNERELLPDAMVAVENATAPRQWRPDDLKAVITAAIDKMLADGRLVVEDMKDLTPKPGRFRRGRGLKAVPI
jgi:hypothetical protein